MNKFDIIKKIAELKPSLINEFNISFIGVFGSYARNNVTEESDIDILVEFNETPGLVKFYTLQDFLENVFQKKVDLITINSLKKEIKDNIYKDLISI